MCRQIGIIVVSDESTSSKLVVEKWLWTADSLVVSVAVVA